MVSYKQNDFTLIECQQTLIYISEAPSKENLNNFIKQIKNNNIKHIVRLCDPTYDLNDLNDLNYDVKIYDWKFTDGDNPPSDIIDKWKELLKLNVGPILIHCMAGLGRAPSIAAIGLIELKIKPFDAIKLIRDKRPGSINSKQLSFIMNYKPTNKKSCIFSKIFSCQYY